MGLEAPSLDVSRIVTLVGTSIAIFTFLLFFLYPRYSSGEIDPILFQVTVTTIGLAIFSLVYAALYYYSLTLPRSWSSIQTMALLRKGDRLWLLGYTILLLEPTLILFTLRLYHVALVWLGLWILYLYLTFHEYRAALRAKVR
ncbi:MAG TPA: hypothetical protein VFE98_04655 [Candidatus Bathyarchaeia archaeon]|nr:hypothetical protein [Candidatus Bathyarchaeia archaeon]